MKETQILEQIFPFAAKNPARICLDAMTFDHPVEVHSHPAAHQKLIDEYHRKYDIAWSYGGWMEDRGRMWKDSYLDAGEKYIHLGIDCNLPAGTVVCTPVLGNVELVGTDLSTEIGWGTYVCIGVKEHVFIFGHLSPLVDLTPGYRLHPGDVIGRIGTYPANGNVFEHAHIQAVRRDIFESLKHDMNLLDGYGHRRLCGRLRVRYPEPLKTFDKHL